MQNVTFLENVSTPGAIILQNAFECYSLTVQYGILYQFDNFFLQDLPMMSSVFKVCRMLSALKKETVCAFLGIT